MLNEHLFRAGNQPLLVGYASSHYYVYCYPLFGHPPFPHVALEHVKVYLPCIYRRSSGEESLRFFPL
jgi:hypothetical protein